MCKGIAGTGRQKDGGGAERCVKVLQGQEKRMVVEQRGV